MWSTVYIGSNTYVGSAVRKTVLRVDGDPIATLEIGHRGELLVSLLLFGPSADKIGELRRNQWVGRQRHFEWACAPQRVVVRRTDQGSQVPVFEASLAGDPVAVAVEFANLYTPRGFQVIIDPAAGVLVRDPSNVRLVRSLSGALQGRTLEQIDLPVHGDRPG